MVGSATAGDIDGDGSLDVVAVTREGNLYAWATAADFQRTGAKSVQWASVSRDVQRSGNLNSGVATSPGDCTSEYRAMIEKVSLKRPAGAANDKVQVSGFANLTGRLLDPNAGEVGITLGGPDGADLDIVIPAGSFKANSSGTSYVYSAKAPGVTKVKLQQKKGIWRFQVKAGRRGRIAGRRARVRAGCGSAACAWNARARAYPTRADETLKCEKPAA